MNKKAQLGGTANVIMMLATVGLTLVLAGLIIGFGLNIQGTVHDTLADCSTIGGATDNMTYNATNNKCYNTSLATSPNYEPGGYETNASMNFLEGGSNLSTQAPNIGLVVGAVVIITLLIVGFGGLMSFRRR